jgi:glycosyltransferase involved in cell wall biosynthesis
VVAGHSAPDLRYLVLAANHGGPSRARNLGASAATGDFITFIDSDDPLLPGHLCRCVRFLTSHPQAGLVFSRGLRRYEDGRLAPHLREDLYPRFYRLPRQAAGAGAWLLERRAAFECLFYENYLLPSGVVLPRHVLAEVGPFDESLRNGDDRDLWFRIAARFPLGFLEAYGFYYRIREGSISRRGAELAVNRIRVLRRQLAGPLPPAAREGARRLIARNLYVLGYLRQSDGEYREARRLYLESLDEAANVAAARGLLLTLLPATVRQRLQSLRDEAAAPAEEKLVSVVVTCFNYGPYLAGCLESILGQTCHSLQILVVNDGSTDNTDEVVAPFLADPRITYVRQENRGQAAAKNAGIALARGEFIAFLDADDRWAHDKLEKQLPLFADPRVGVVYSRSRHIDAEGTAVAVPLPGKYLRPRAGLVTEHLFLDNFVPFSSAVVRRECFDRHGRFDESLPMGIDWDLWLRLSVEYRFAYVDEPLLAYRIGHPGQMSRQAEIRQSCSDRIMGAFLERHPDLVSRRVVRRAMAHTCRNRGAYFQAIDAGRAFAYYRRAITVSPLEWPSYRGLLKMAVFNLTRKFGLWRGKLKSPT